MVTFKEGDKVVLANYGQCGFGAKIGATATVGTPRSNTLVEILWDRDMLSRNQCNGG